VLSTSFPHANIQNHEKHRTNKFPIPGSRNQYHLFIHRKTFTKAESRQQLGCRTGPARELGGRDTGTPRAGAHTAAEPDKQSAGDIPGGSNLKVLPAAPEVRTNPLIACSREIKLYGIPGLQISVQNEGFYTNYLIMALPEFTVTDCQPFKQGKLKAVQTAFQPRYTITSESPQFPVGPPRKPDTPHIDAPYCQSQQLQTLLMSDLTPGATITVFSRKDSNQNPVVVGIAYIASKQQSLPVPASMFSNANVPIGPNSQVAVSMDLCGVKSELSNWIGIGPAYNEKTPFLNPLIDCANFAVLNNCTAGTVIQLWVTNHVGQMYNLLKTPYVAFEGTNIIYFYRSVHKDESIGGYCNFCNNFVVIKDVTVANEYNKGTILRPIKPGDTILNFKDCVIGSRIEAYYVVNDVTTYTNFGYPESTEWSMKLPKAAELPPQISIRINHVSYHFKVFVCNQMISEGDQTVKLGQLKVSVDPPSVYDDNYDAVKISAVDIDYGNSIGAKVAFNELDVFPNSNYASDAEIGFNVPKGRTAPYIGHVSALNYENTSFSFAVTKKPVPIVTSLILNQDQYDDLKQTSVKYKLTVIGSGLTPNAQVSVGYSSAQLETVDSTNYLRSQIPLLGPTVVLNTGQFGKINSSQEINLVVRYYNGDGIDPYDPYNSNNPYTPLSVVLNQGVNVTISYDGRSSNYNLTNGVPQHWA